MTYTVSIFDFVDFSDEVSMTTKVGAVEDTISFGDGVFSGRSSGNTVDGIIWKETLTPVIRATRNFTETLTFTEFTHWRTVFANLNDVFFMIDLAEKVPDKLFRDTLTLNDSMAGFKTLGPADKLQLTDSLNLKILASPVLPDSLTFIDSMKVYYNDPWRFPS